MTRVAAGLGVEVGSFTQRCAPGRAGRFQTCPTGFDSSHRCCGIAALSCRRGSIQKGAGLALSQFANGGSCGCESCRRPSSPADVMNRMAVFNARWTRFDGRRPKNSPAEFLMHNASSECGGFARDPAKVEDQVRFLAGTLFISTTRHRCSMVGRLPAKQLIVSSILTGVSLMLALMLSLPAVRWAQESA